jgi:hypothetical protein
VICVQKGKPWYAALGFLCGWFSLIGACRIAKPGSSWFYKRYVERGEAWKVEMGRVRFPQEAIVRDRLHAPESVESTSTNTLSIPVKS